MMMADMVVLAINHMVNIGTQNKCNLDGFSSKFD